MVCIVSLMTPMESIVYAEDSDNNIPSITPVEPMTDTKENTSPENNDLTIEPTPTAIPEPSLEPSITPEPTVEPSITPDPSVEPTPSPEPIITTIPTVSPTPTPFIPDTLKRMKDVDYVEDSVTGISEKKEKKEALQMRLANYGTLRGTGMPFGEYKKAMNNEWIDCTDYKHKPGNIKVDLKQTINYNRYVDILKKLSRYDGVYLYEIGSSTDGRKLYAIEIDVESTKEKNVIMLTGSVHAREFAGGSYILKQFVDLVQQAQTNKKTMKLLKENKYVAVPIINVDGRECLIDEPQNWTDGNGNLWKAYTNGTDGNRNFPGLSWEMIAKGQSLSWSKKTKPGAANFAGKYAGSNLETMAMMKWLYHYVVIEKANCLVDMHQQGRVIYAGKEWSKNSYETNSNIFRKKVLSKINFGNAYRYKVIEDNQHYGLNGAGSSITDYASAIAYGAKFSPAYGFLCFSDLKKEYVLLQFKDMDHLKFPVKVPNKSFVTVTVESGTGKSYLGNSRNTRQRLSNEYSQYHFDTLLTKLPTLLP